MPAVGITDIRTKRGDFYLLGNAGFGVFGDNDYAELRPDSQAVREEVLDAIGSGVRGDVIVGRFAFEQDVAHATTDEVSLMACRAQGAADAFRECTGVHGHDHNYD